MNVQGTLFFLGIIALAIVSLVASRLDRLALIFQSYDNISGMLEHQRVIAPSNETQVWTSKCEYPIVYNKPPKTASTFIQNTIANWAKKQGRSNYRCGGWPMESAIRLQECVPANDDGCGVVNCHLYLDDTVTSVLQSRLPNYRLITSTRYPPHRIISNYMQMKAIVLEKGLDISDGLRDYLVNEYNPSEIISWHSGVIEARSCPISEADRIHLFNLVSKYFIVIDLNLIEESNAILQHHGLFTLPDSTTRVNLRGAETFKVPNDIKALLYNVSCYERALHEALQLRMGSLYELATKRRCVVGGRLDSFSSCLAKKERENLKDSWIF